MKKIVLIASLILLIISPIRVNAQKNNGISNFSFFSKLTGSLYPYVKDIEGNRYKTIFIGDQRWMTENLKVGKYNDGTIIPNVIEDKEWVNLTTGAWAYYDNENVNNITYGKLYNWYVVSLTMNGNKNVCPKGWHVPSDSDWQILVDYLGGEYLAGGKMKDVNHKSWDSSYINIESNSLFNGTPGGDRDYGGGFYGIRNFGYWWSSSYYGEEDVWSWFLDNDTEFMLKSHNFYTSASSIRCIKD